MTLSTNQKSLEKLETLDLLDCPLTKQEDYRGQVFALLPGLKSLDGLNQAGEEMEESDSEGEGQNYSRTSGKGPSEIGTTSLQRHLFRPHVNTLVASEIGTTSLHGKKNY